MKKKFLFFAFFIIISFNLQAVQINAPLSIPPDSTRSTGTEEGSTRESVPRSGNFSSFSGDADFLSTCMCCLFNTLGDIIFESDDEEETPRKPKPSRYLEPYRLYVGLRIGAGTVITDAKEYEKGGLLFGPSLNAYVNGFTLSASYDYSINSGDPATDFVTNFSLPGNHTREFYDIVTSTSVTSSVLGIGLGYQFPVFEDYDGTIMEIGFNLKAHYMTITENTEFKREIYDDNSFTSSSNLENELIIKKFTPGFGFNMMIIPPFSDKLAFEMSLEFVATHRSPEQILSTPLDNYEFNGLASVVFAIKYSL
ncbi:MAG: hypothetical protein AB9882_13740 [Ignavibacteriaceae bacterium]